jgi:hypothetical protein
MSLEKKLQAIDVRLTALERQARPRVEKSDDLKNDSAY